MSMWRDNADEIVWVEGVVVAVTEDAFLLRDGDHEFWLPKSQIKDGNEEPEVWDDGEWGIPGWLAARKGLA